jgi:mono/diheme cytochrome c family protein
MNWQKQCCFVILIGLGISCAAAESRWIANVPATDRNRTHPYALQPESVAAGSKLYAEYCAQCHGSDALGRGKRPSLRSSEVQQAADGELFWLLKNGNRRRGMPSWVSLPEPSRWQIIAFIKSLGVYDTTASAKPSQEKPR